MDLRPAPKRDYMAGFVNLIKFPITREVIGFVGEATVVGAR